MRALPKGINKVRKRLKSDEWVTYYYAWKGGPRLRGESGSPEFLASYEEALLSVKRPPKDELRSLIDRYRESSAFLNLAPRTKRDYGKHLLRIEAQFGDLPIALLADRRVRGDFLEWRDKIGKKSPRTADHLIQVLARVISWAFDRGLAPANPLTRPGRLYNGDRREQIWTAEQEKAFYDKAPKHLHLPLTLGLWTGQRQGDLLRLKWSDYDGRRLPLKQGKTKAPVPVPVAEPLRRALEAAKAGLLQPDENGAVMPLPETILTNSRRKPWTSWGFSASWRKACAKAGVTGVTFHDLRGTMVIRLARAHCSVPEIGAITGHSPKDVEDILRKHYMGWDAEIAENAIRKLEKKAKCPTGRPTKRPTGR